MEIVARDRILEQAARLFAQRSYGSVTINDIALAARVNSADIYEHYSGKGDVLSSIYDRYVETIAALRPTEEEYLPILLEGTAAEIMAIFNYPLPDPVDFHFNCVRVVWGRRHLDERAHAISMDSYLDGQAFIRQVLTRGIALGRLDLVPGEVEAIQCLIQAGRDFMCNIAILDLSLPYRHNLESSMAEQLAVLLRLREPEQLPEPLPGGPSAVEQFIRDDAAAASLYYHCLSRLDPAQDQQLIMLLEEIRQNLLDSQDALYPHTAESAAGLDTRGILDLVLRSETARRQAARRLQHHPDEEIARLYTDVAELASHHERILRDTKVKLILKRPGKGKG